jgi:hypothetical protein
MCLPEILGRLSPETLRLSSLELHNSPWEHAIQFGLVVAGTPAIAWRAAAITTRSLVNETM